MGVSDNTKQVYAAIASPFTAGAQAVGNVANMQLREGRELKRAARNQASNLQRRTDEEAELIRLRAGRLAGEQRASIAAGGLSGSPMLAVRETLNLALDDIRRMRIASSDEQGLITQAGRRANRGVQLRLAQEGIQGATGLGFQIATGMIGGGGAGGGGEAVGQMV